METTKNEKFMIIKIEDYKIKPLKVFQYEKNTKKFKLLSEEEIKDKEIKELYIIGKIK